MQILLKKFKDTFLSVLPIVVIVVVLYLTIVPLQTDVFLRFLLGSFLIIIGLTLFIMGVDIGIAPIGNLLGKKITKSNKLWLLLSVGVILGIVITVAEPSLIILANQINTVTAGIIKSSSIILFVSLGTGIMLSVGLIRIVYSISLKSLLAIFYGIVLVLSIFSNIDFLGIAFDSSGATTGALAVPFILAIALGASNIKKDSKSGEDDSFGLVGVASIGAIIAVLIMGIINSTGEMQGTLDITQASEQGVIMPFVRYLPTQIIEVIVALLPILILFLSANFISFKLKKHKFAKILVGIILSSIGLIFFLLGVNKGFMDVGSIVGATLVQSNQNVLLVIIAFILGIVTILAEPAVHILTKQIEEVTSAYVKRNLVMITLALGVGIAVALSALRVMLPGMKLWHILLPGYIISILLSRFTPNLFIGIAFDSGGVASGPMTATFVLAFIQGISSQIENSNVILDGFGVIALVAMIPLIALQILGLIFKMKLKKVQMEEEKEREEEKKIEEQEKLFCSISENNEEVNIKEAIPQLEENINTIQEDTVEPLLEESQAEESLKGDNKDEQARIC